MHEVLSQQLMVMTPALMMGTVWYFHQNSLCLFHFLDCVWKFDSFLCVSTIHLPSFWHFWFRSQYHSPQLCAWLLSICLVMLNDPEIKANLEEAAGLEFIPLGNYLAWKKEVIPTIYWKRWKDCVVLVIVIQEESLILRIHTNILRLVTYKYTEVSFMVAIMKENPVCEREWIGCLTCHEYVKS